MNLTKSTGCRSKQPFPYEVLLAYLRERLSDTDQKAEISRLVVEDARWKAHHDSARFLDLDGDAALSDGRELERLAHGETRIAEDDLPFCLLAAQNDGKVLDDLLQGKAQAAGHSLKEWGECMDHCVYVRRVWLRRHSRYQAVQAGMPPGERLLRDWLQEHLYLQALRDVTAKLVASSQGTAEVAQADVETVMDERSEPRAPEEGLTDQEMLEALHAARHLPLPLGDLYVLHYLRRTSIEDVAALCGMSTDDVQQALDKARHEIEVRNPAQSALKRARR